MRGSRSEFVKTVVTKHFLPDTFLYVRIEAVRAMRILRRYFEVGKSSFSISPLETVIIHTYSTGGICFRRIRFIISLW